MYIVDYGDEALRLNLTELVARLRPSGRKLPGARIKVVGWSILVIESLYEDDDQVAWEHAIHDLLDGIPMTPRRITYGRVLAVIAA